MTPRLNGYLLAAPPVLLLAGIPLYLADAPFGWWHVLVVYLLATFPLAMLLAERSAAEVNPHLLAVLGVVLGAGSGLATALAGKHAVQWLNQQQADLFARQGTLGLWCLLLQLPWCAVGLWVVTRWTKVGRGPAPSWEHVLLGLIVASALPAVWVARVINVESKKAEELIQAGRRVKASEIAGKLRKLGSTRLLAGQEPRIVHFLGVFGYEGGLRRLWIPPATDEDRMELASQYASWDDFEIAAEMLLPVTGRDPAAALLLASIYKEQKKWKESGQYCRLALALLDRVPPSEAAITGRVQAYDNLAAVALEQKRYDEARKVYEEAMPRVPPARAYFHFQLGRLHHSAGRPFKALEHLQEAVKLDPESYEARAGDLVKEIRMHTPGCVLRWLGP